MVACIKECHRLHVYCIGICTKIVTFLLPYKLSKKRDDQKTSGYFLIIIWLIIWFEMFMHSLLLWKHELKKKKSIAVESKGLIQKKHPVCSCPRYGSLSMTTWDVTTWEFQAWPVMDLVILLRLKVHHTILTNLFSFLPGPNKIITHWLPKDVLLS